jgi:Tfp pilus assembly protein PilF
MVSTVLLFIVFFQTTRKIWQSGFVAALFSIHPLNVEPVAWIALHDHPLSTLFMILGLLAYLHYVKGKTIKAYLVVLFFYIAGLMSKPTNICLPVLLLIFDYWPLQRLLPGQSVSSQPQSRLFPVKKVLGHKPVIEKLPLFIVSALWLAGSLFFYKLSDFSQLNIMPEIGFSSLSLLWQIPVSYAAYIVKLFFPIDLLPSRLLPPFYPESWHIIVSSLLLIFITCISFLYARKGHRYFVMGWLWFLVISAPGVFMNAMKHSLVTDRYVYISAIGIFVVFAWGLGEVLSGLRYKRTAAGSIGIVIIVIFMSLSWAQTKHWQDRITICRQAVKVAPHNSQAYCLLGDALLSQNKNIEALAVYKKAFQLDPDSAFFCHNIGVLNYKLGNTLEAADAFRKALRLMPDYANSHHNLGNLLLDQGRIKAAIDHFEAALKIDPTLFQTHNSLATALLYDGQRDKALSHFQKALLINPSYKTARENIQKVLDRNGSVR